MVQVQEIGIQCSSDEPALNTHNTANNICESQASPAQKSQKNLDSHPNQKMEPANSMVPKVADTAPRVVLTWALLAQRGEGG